MQNKDSDYSFEFYAVKNNGDLAYQTTKYMNVGIVIPRYAELSLGPENMPHDPSSTQHVLNLGILESGKEEGAVLNVKGNVPFGVYMASQNGGKLANSPSEIPYTVKVGASNYLSLSNPGQNYFITQNNSGTPMAGTPFPIRIKVGNVPPGTKAGEYEDVITVTVTAW